MKKSLLKKLPAKSESELKTMLEKLKDDLDKISFEIKGGQLKNVGIVSEKKRDIAQALTVLRLKELSKT